MISSCSAWNLPRDRPWPPGTAHAARHGPDGSAGTLPADPEAGGLAMTALTGSLLTDTAHRRSGGPSYHRRFCCPPGSTGTAAASDAHPASDPLPGGTGYRTPPSVSKIRRLPGRGGPPRFPPSLSMRSAPHTPGSPSRLRFQALDRFRGLRPGFGGSDPPWTYVTVSPPIPLGARTIEANAGSMLQALSCHRKSPSIS
jgi:hypothetical protein